MSDGFWDGNAPYGRNGYAFGSGEFVADWRPVQEIGIRMRDGADVLSSLGVVELADGRVYRFAHRIAGAHWGGQPLKSASLLRQSFADAARLMVEMETGIGRADPVSLADAAAKVDAL
jgi:hypothetical protein